MDDPAISMLDVKMTPLSDIRPYENNPRKNTASVSKVAQSLQEFGWRQPIVVDKHGVIVAGHTRFAAAQYLGMTEAPVHWAMDMTPTQARRYRIADNRTHEDAEWDFELLAKELQELKAEGAGEIEGLGFDQVEFDKLLGIKPQTDPDDVPPEPAVAVSVLGDVWLLGGHRLVCGDSTDAAAVAACLGKEKPHLMVTDPPYGVEYDASWRKRAGVNLNKAKLGIVDNDNRADWKDAWVLFPGDVAYVWHAGRHASEVQTSLEDAKFAVRSQIIWAKDRMVLSRGDYHWQHEPCWYAVREKATGHWASDRKQTTLWNIKAREDAGHGHSTQKPVECMRRPIENNSVAGDSVYEPFSGSGTTIIAAEQTGRRCLAIELNPIYVDVAVLRWQMFTRNSATLESTGETWEQIANARRPKAE